MYLYTYISGYKCLCKYRTAFFMYRYSYDVKEQPPLLVELFMVRAYGSLLPPRPCL